MPIGQLQRREFITLLGGTAAAWPLTARAQQAERMRKVGVLAPAAAGTPLWQGYIAAFREELQKLGWSPRNVAIEERWGGTADQVRSHAAELVAMAPDVILGGAATGSRALQQATRTIPIVFAFVPDPVALGLVTSLARPGGNISGFANYEPVVAVKWLELLKQIAPGITRVTFIYDPVNPVVPAYIRQLETAASSFAVTMSAAMVRNAEEIEHALNDVAKAPNSGLIVAPGAALSASQTLFLGLAAQHRLPAVYPFHEVVKDGGLASYGVDASDLFRRAASYVDRILKGEKPGDLPVEFATKFQLTINLKTAKALGLDPPIQLLARTDQVIE
jgi:putative tryptophan/tyrosine transport system substrate-binding protein